MTTNNTNMRVKNALDVEGIGTSTFVGGVQINGTSTLNDTVTINGALIVPNSYEGTFGHSPYVALTPAQVSNPEVGPISMYYAAIAAGKPLYTDEEFAVGNNSVAVYNNGTGNITITRAADASAPNKTGYSLAIAYDGTGAPSPGRGGFCQIFNSRRNATFVQRFIAKIPVGYSVIYASNSIGTNNNQDWITSTAGTGKWEEYLRYAKCGNTGTFSSAGHVYLSGPSGAVTWYLASCNAYEINTSGIADWYQNGGTVVGNISANRYTSTVATGTAPLTVSSTTKVANLNADLLDGLESTDFMGITGRNDSLDYNTAILSGVYGPGSAPTNGPAGIAYSTLISAKNSDVGLQIAGGYTNDDLWFRGWYTSGSNFTAWRKVWHDGNFTPANYASLLSPAFTGSPTVSGQPIVTQANINSVYSNANTASASPASAGWYRIAQAIGSEGRSSFNVNLMCYSGGGCSVANFTVSKGWTDDLTKATITVNNTVQTSVIQQLRLIYDSATNNLYVEAYINVASAALSYVAVTHPFAAVGGSMNAVSVAFTTGATATHALTYDLSMFNADMLVGGNNSISYSAFSGAKYISYALSNANKTGQSGVANVHLVGDGTSDRLTGITTNGTSTSASSQAGVLFQSSGGYGTKIWLQTTDVYASGMKDTWMLDHQGTQNLYRGQLVIDRAASGGADAYAKIGHNRAGNGYAYVDLVGDAAYTDYGLRILRGNTGANSGSYIYHRGTGDFAIQASEVASISLQTSATERLRIGTTAITATLPVLAPIRYVDRQNNPASGISWYTSGYKAWATYMAQAGQASVGPTGNITAPSGTLVTSWGLRNYIENVTGYGWTFESGTANQTTPTVVAEISSVDGSARFGPSVTAGGYNLRKDLYATNAGGAAGQYQVVGGGSLSVDAANQTGMIKIRLPAALNNADAMLRIVIKGYDYTTNGAFTLVAGGYTYAPVTNWLSINYSATLTGKAPFTSVRFAHDGTSYCLLLGTTSTTWQYPKVWVETVDVGYTNEANTAWTTGWSITQITDETGITVNGTVSDLYAPLAKLDSPTFVNQITTPQITMANGGVLTDTGSYLYWKGGATTTGVRIMTSDSVGRGYLYAEAGGIGLLDAGGSWNYRGTSSDAQIYQPLTANSTITAGGPIRANSTIDQMLILNATTGGNPYMAFFRSGSRESYIQNTTGGLLVVNEKNTPILFYTNNLDRGRFAQTGEFLVGTSSIGTLGALLRVNGGIEATNFHDTTGTYNVNLGSGGVEGRGLVAGYSGGSYGGIGFNIRHTATGGQWIAPSSDTASYLLFTAGGMQLNGWAAGTAGRTLTAAVKFGVDVNGNATVYNNLAVDGTVYIGGSTAGPILAAGAGAAARKTLRITSTDGYIDVGAQNASYCHFSTDRPIFHMNVPLEVATRVGVYGTNNYIDGTGVKEGNVYLSAKYLGISAKAADSELLDGLNSTSYMRYTGWVTNPGYDANTMLDNTSGFTYANNAPYSGPIVYHAASGYGLQLNGTYNQAVNELAFRTRNGDASAWNGWRKVFHEGHVIPVANGGTGVATSTGSGSLVLSISPALTGTPTAPTAAVNNNTTQLATTAFVGAQIAQGATVSSGAIFSETFDAPNALDSWEPVEGNGSAYRAVTTTIDGMGGGKTLRIGDFSGDDEVWLAHKKLIPYDPTKLYRIRVWARRVTGTGTFYAGFAGIASDGITLVNAGGSATVSSQHYCAAAGAAPGTTFTLYTGYVKGVSGTAGGVSPNSWAPKAAHTNVRYIRPLLIANYSAQAGQMDIGSFTIDEYSPQYAVQSVGTGIPVYLDTDGTTGRHRFRAIQAGYGVYTTLSADGNSVVINARAAETSHIYLKDDRSSASTTLTDITDFRFSLANVNTTYSIELIGAYTAGATTTGLKLGCTLPTGSTVTMQVVGSNANSATQIAMSATGTTSASVTLGSASTTTAQAVSAKFLVTVGGTAGNFQLQHAVNSTSTVTLKAGTVLIVRQLFTATPAVSVTLYAGAPMAAAYTALDEGIIVSTAQINVNVLSDGTWTVTKSTSTDTMSGTPTSGSWATPTTAGAGDGYEVLFTIANSVGYGSITNSCDVYTSITQTRTFSVSVTDSSGGSETHSLNLTTTIRKIGTTTPTWTNTTTLTVDSWRNNGDPL